jgi:NADH-quinone oxidoreductase subunit M
MTFSSYLLLASILLPLCSAFYLLGKKELSNDKLQQFALTVSLLVFLLTLGLWLEFDPYQMTFQSLCGFSLPFLSDYTCLLGIDGISLLFIVLTSFLFPFCILINWNQLQTNIKEYLISFLLLETFLILVFCVLDLLLFYIFFESVLIPVFLYIGIWGSRERKIYAAYLLFLYTLVGSLIMLVGIITIYHYVGSTDFHLVLVHTWDLSLQNLLWISFFSSFAVKVPMFPFHIWLPEAHTEAPTAGSVLLAGILLKLGGYGFIRFSLPMFPQSNSYFLPLVFTLSIVAIIYTSLTTLRQSDMKRIIAYSSVGHMSLVVVGLFSMNLVAFEGAYFLMLSHGIVSGGLFLCIGIIYYQHKTRILKYYGGLIQVMPLFITILFILGLANLSLPGTSSFTAEFLILLGAFSKNIWMTILASTTIVLGACYTLWFYNRLSFGNLKTDYITSFQDLNRKDFSLFVPLVLFVFLAGIYPNPFFSVLHASGYFMLFPNLEGLPFFLINIV